MSRSIVHIGYHKTATNWFQRNYYPSVRNRRYVHRKKVKRAFLADSALHFDAARAAAALEVDSLDGLLLCEEELSGNIHTGGLFGCFTKEIARRIREVLPEAEIVIFVRNQVDMIASVYKQYVKEGGTYSVDRYLHPYRYLPRSGFQPAKAPLFSFDHFDYHALALLYGDLFGPDRVHVFLYEEFSRDNRAFLERYAERFELEVDLASVPRSRPNPPYGRLVLPMARALNWLSYRDVLYKQYLLHVPLMYKLRGMVLERLNRLPAFGAGIPSTRILGEANVAFIRERYVESNRRLAADCDLPLAEHGYPL